MKKYLIITTLLLMSTPIWSQKITGQVKNTQSEPLPFATIWSETLNKGTNANEKGEFVFQLSPGEHKITFRYVGHAPKEVIVRLETNSEKKYRLY